MKKYLTILAAMAVAATIPANAYKTYAELLGLEKGLLSRKVTIRVDLGQSVKMWKQNDMKIVDETGKDIVFNSMVDAMNYMGARGWEFEQAYVVTEGAVTCYRWLLSKEVNSDEDIKAGLNLKADVKKEENPSYTLTFLKKSKSSSQWDVVSTDSKRLSNDELSEIVDKWKSQTNDKYDYDVKVNREK